jgi:hypothetical protein
VSLPLLPPACLLTAGLDCWVLGEVAALRDVQEALARLLQQCSASQLADGAGSTRPAGVRTGEQLLSTWQQLPEWNALPQSLRDPLGAHLHRAAAAESRSRTDLVSPRV